MYQSVSLGSIRSYDKHHRAPPRHDGKVVSPPIPSDSACIEVFLPTGGQSTVILSRVDHVYREFLHLAKTSNKMGSATEIENKLLNDSPTQSCENNVNCYSSWDDEKRAGLGPFLLLVFVSSTQLLQDCKWFGFWGRKREECDARVAINIHLGCSCLN